MATIVTSTAKVFDVLNPDPKLICREDIVAGLSRICRFTGQLRKDREIYTVAQHSVLATRWAMRLDLESKAHRLYNTYKCLGILLHDASEAYLSDISSPLKRELPYYREIEVVLQDTIFKKYVGRSVCKHEYHMYDKYAYWLEIQHIMPRHPELDRWADVIPPIPIPWIVEHLVSETWYPYEAYHEFMRLWVELDCRIGDA
jgi:hypothetical protein